MPDPGSVPLKEHIEALLAALDRRYEQRFAEMDLRYEQRFNAQEVATSAALVTTKEALTIAVAGVKESNASAIEANKTLATEAEKFADQKLQTHNAIRPWVESLVNIQAEKIMGLAEKIMGLERRISRFENREEGINWTTKLIIGAAGLIATLVGIYFAFR